MDPTTGTKCSNKSNQPNFLSSIARARKGSFDLAVGDPVFPQTKSKKRSIHWLPCRPPHLSKSIASIWVISKAPVDGFYSQESDWIGSREDHLKLTGKKQIPMAGVDIDCPIRLGRRTRGRLLVPFAELQWRLHQETGLSGVPRLVHFALQRQNVFQFHD